ncbi:LysR family transcriptional regulator [Paroceanicella profunda]|uniref:LysR family transcriptional regulator n=1 Tax=Paroceanicella profunda TaxID=2579971 RepID=A0A5B8G470_9RHOB|nr:LysR family transcriptional regulator [Paroceanicella profunda]QDL93683.1 LysR family transcriptional regulator [Paroceanicella profunda]
MDWDRLRIFHAVADAGSLTHAGESLNLSQSAVSRQIRHLEEALSCTLFHRHARGLILTEQGELLFEATKSMAKRLDSATARIRDAEDEVFGELRVTATTGFGTLWLAPRLGRLYDQYPNLKIQLLLEERVLDLPMREADVAIRMKEPSQADIIRRRLIDIRMRLYASPEYIATKGLPRTVDELSDHRLLFFTIDSHQVSAGRQWMQRFVDNENTSRLSVNNYFGVLQAVRHGLGIGALPEYLAVDSPDLVNVLPEECSDTIPVYFAYAQELRQSKRVEAFRDFVLAEISGLRKALGG